MRNDQLESSVLSLYDAIQAGRVPEDSRVEFKAEWPADHRKAARRLGGHANASRGDPVLWVIGLDEKRGLTGADRADLADWYPQVVKSFDGVAPELLKDLDIPVGGKRVVALLFDTSRPPYVVKNPAGGDVCRDVPWRMGTRVDSATREQLLRLLSPLQQLPSTEIIDFQLACRVGRGNGQDVSNLTWEMVVNVLFLPSGTVPVVIPFHSCDVTCEMIPSGSVISLGKPTIIPFRPIPFNPRTILPQGAAISLHPGNVRASEGETVIQGPASVTLSAASPTSQVSDARLVESAAAKATIRLRVAGVDTPLILTATLHRGHETPDAVRWAANPPGA